MQQKNKTKINTGTIEQKGSEKMERNYQPMLPKVSPCEEIIAVDVMKDKSYHSWQAKEVLMVCTCIQGIVNRESAKKIYFTGFPNEHDWDAPDTDRMQLELEGFYPVDHTYAKLDMEKTYPALDYLLSEYKSYIKGAVACPELKYGVCDGAVMAAVTACGQLDAIPVSPWMEKYLEANGFYFTILDDTRHLTNNVEAFDWSYDKYFQGKGTARYAGHHSYNAFGGREQDQFPNLYDYFIATKAFVFCLNGNHAEERAKLPKILNENNYPLATPVIGLPVDEGEGLGTIEELGYYFIIMNVQNLSCTSGFESNPALIQKPPAPAVRKIEDNDIVMAFYVTDGDSCGHPACFHFDEWLNCYQSDVAPVGWSFNPILLDVFPSLVYWRFRYKPELSENVMDWNDQRQMGTLRRSNTRAWKEYCKQIGAYCAWTGIVTTNYFEGDISFCHLVEPLMQIKGYGSDLGNVSYVAQVDDTVSMTLTGTTPRHDPYELVQAVDKAIKENTEEGISPQFILLTVGTGHCQVGCGDMAYKTEEVMRRLVRKYPDKNFKFMLPRDLAASWKAWKAGK